MRSRSGECFGPDRRCRVGVLDVKSTEPGDFSTDTISFLVSASTIIGMAT